MVSMKNLLVGAAILTISALPLNIAAQRHFQKLCTDRNTYQTAKPDSTKPNNSTRISGDTFYLEGKPIRHFQKLNTDRNKFLETKKAVDSASRLDSIKPKE